MIVFRRLRGEDGFALPTILIASTILMIVLTVAAAAATSMSVSLGNQYYNQLAHEAAESALIRAEDCMASNYNQMPAGVTTIASWGTNCKPSSSGGDVDGTVEDPTGGNDPTKFSKIGIVYDATQQLVSYGIATFSGGNTISASGYVKRFRSDNVVWQTYNATVNVRVSSAVGAQKLTFGYDFSYGAFFATIGQDGVVRAVGNNHYGQLGNNSTTNATTPVVFPLPAGETPKSMATSFVSLGQDLFVITTSGDVYGAGNNAYGQLGNGAATANQATPVKMNLPAGEQAQSITTLGYATYVLTKNSSSGVYSLYDMGTCDQGVLGNTTACPPASESTSYVSTPTKVPLPSGEVPTTTMTADNHSFYVMMTDGKVYGWGRNTTGQMANGTTTEQDTPLQIGTFGNGGAASNATNVLTDGETVYVLDSNQNVWGSGRGNLGELCYGRTGTVNTSLVGLNGASTPIIQMATDQETIFMLATNGRIYGCGLDSSGQLGDGNPPTSVQPNAQIFQMPSGAGSKFVSVYNAQQSNPNINDTFGITDTGNVVGAGSNYYGQLGNGCNETGTTNLCTSQAAVSTPVVMNVVGTTHGIPVAAGGVKTGYGTTVITTAAGAVYTVGNNAQGQLGDGTTTNNSTPQANRYTNTVPITFF